MSKCGACSKHFRWTDDVVVVNDNFYHKDCVSLYPTGYVAFIGDDCLGETENDDGQMAIEITGLDTIDDD